MKIEKIKPIPKYILKLIKRADDKDKITTSGRIRFYSYLTKNDGELVKVTVACKNKGKRWRCKQVVVHGVHSDMCFIKDICFHYMGNYSVGWFEEGLQKSPKWYESKEWGLIDDKYFNIKCPILNEEYALRLPEYRYSALNLYPYFDTFKYLRLYEKFPQAEMLIKFGLYNYATSIQILNKTGKDKQFRKWLISNQTNILRRGYYVGTLLKAYKTGKPIEEVQKIEERKRTLFRNDNYMHIKRLFTTDKEITTFIDYIESQKTNISSYSDYLKACTYLGLDMNLQKNRLPHNFKRWHDIRIDEYHTAKALKDVEERKELYAQFADIAEKYLPLQRESENEFIVIIAKSPQDLIREGEILQHCVGRMNYDQRFIREESLIFFVRNKQAPDIPFVTLEYSLKNHKVLQCYGARDKKPDEQVLKFVNNTWLPYANKQIKKIVKVNKQVA